MHLGSDRLTQPVCGSRSRACGVHTVTHGASAQCWHIMGTEKPSTSQVLTCTRLAIGRNAPSCTIAHASSQLRQPVHLSALIIKNFWLMLVLRMRSDVVHVAIGTRQ